MDRKLVSDPVPPAPRVSPRARKAMAVLAVLLLLAAAHHFGVLAQFGEPARAARTLVELGVWGYVGFVVAYAALQPFGVPGTVFILAAPLIWPWPVAFALSMTGTMAASVVGFSFSRFVARDWFARIVPARLKRYEDALERRAFATVFLLRFIFWMPPPLHAFFGVSKVGFWPHFWGSLAGYALPLLLVSFFGQKLFDAFREAPREVGLGMAAATLVVLGAAWIVRRRLRRGASSRA